jgi:ABC-2 type transport system permease protein
MSQLPERIGAIYDIGYRRYEGTRLGRRAALESLFAQGFRAAFGLGRRPASKVAPFLLASLALIPAAVYLGIAAIAPADLEVTTTDEYLQDIFIILVLFVAAVSPEVVGRDLRFRTLSLYFTRPLARDDYALMRLAALAVATLAVTLVPQTVLVIGNVLAANDAWEYVREEWEQAPQVIASGVVAAAYSAAIGVAIACHTHRRTFAMGGVVAFFIIMSALSEILGDTVDGLFILLNPAQHVRSATLLIFGKDADPGELLGEYDVPLGAGALLLAGVFAGAVAIIMRRYRRVSA